MRKPASSHATRAIFALVSFVLLVTLLTGFLAACANQPGASDPAGTATQDPPVPQLTQETHGIVDTTGTVPQGYLEQLRTRSDEVQAHGYQIAVVFFNDLASDPHQFATQVFNTNGIGAKDKNNGVLLVLYLKKPGTDGHAPWLSYITGGGISTALPDTLMDDYVQTTFVPARAQGHWQNGLLEFYDKISAAEQDPSVAQEWQSQHPQSQDGASSSATPSQAVGIGILVGLAIVFWLVASAVVAAHRRQNFFYTAFRLLGRFLFVLALLSRGTGGSSRSSGSRSWGSGSRGGGGGSGPWGGGGSSPSSGGDV
jgi:uncharacterized protein